MSLARSGGRRHRIRDLGFGCFRLSWQYEHKYPGSRVLHHRTIERDTNREGALRFARKWKCDMPGARGP